MRDYYQIALFHKGLQNISRCFYYSLQVNNLKSRDTVYEQLTACKHLQLVLRHTFVRDQIAMLLINI